MLESAQEVPEEQPSGHRAQALGVGGDHRGPQGTPQKDKPWHPLATCPLPLRHV